MKDVDLMIIKNKSNHKVLASNAWMLESFLDRSKGLMFRRISSGDGCVLVNPVESVLESGIHMMFVPQSLSVIWVNSDLEVVSVKKCPKANLFNWWRVYHPSRPAKYVIELLDSKGTLPGDRIQFIK